MEVQLVTREKQEQLCEAKCVTARSPIITS
jgi:hypothetical protein